MLRDLPLLVIYMYVLAMCGHVIQHIPNGVSGQHSTQNNRIWRVVPRVSIIHDTYTIPSYYYSNSPLLSFILLQNTIQSYHLVPP